MKINIGCGYDKREGWINIDKAEEVKPDMVVDIEKGLPFGDNSVDEIYSHHCLEHIRPGRWKFVLAEIARVAKPGCILELDLPFDNIASRTNIDHYRAFTFSSFDQLIDNTPLRHYYSPLKLHRLERKPFKIIRILCALFPLLKNNIHFKFSIVK
jgi:SAM-dependent methyltransferase